MADLEELVNKQAQGLPQKPVMAEPPKEDLGAKVANEKGFGRKAFDLAFNSAFAVGATALSTSLLGPAGIWVGGAFAGGGLIGGLATKKKTGKSMYDIVNTAVRTYGAVNAVLYPMTVLGNATFPLIPNNNLLGIAGRSLYASTAYIAAFVGLFKGADYLSQNKLNPKGIGKYVADGYAPLAKRMMKSFSPSSSLVANGIGSIAGIPTFAYNALPAAMYNEFRPPGEKKEKKAKVEPEQEQMKLPEGMPQMQKGMPGAMPQMQRPMPQYRPG